jgi:hypothetical protein
MPGPGDHSRLQNRGTVMGVPESGLRYMRRRRVGSADRNGDPLDGVVNLFNVAIVLAVGLLFAALAAVGMTGLLTNENLTIVTDPGTPEMQVIVKEGDKITKLDMESGSEVSGVGTLLGSFYKLADGTVVYVPAGQTAPDGSIPVPGVTPAPSATSTPGVTPYPTPTLTPSTAFPTAPPTPTPGVTLTPDTGVAPVTGGVTEADSVPRGTP